VPLAVSNSLTFAIILLEKVTTPLSSILIASVSEAEPIVPSSGNTILPAKLVFLAISTVPALPSKVI